MKIYYWSPFINYVATTNAVINSIKSINKYSKEKFNCLIVDVLKEWEPYLSELAINKIKVKNLNSFLNIKYLPKKGYFNSRITYIIVFILTIFKLHNFIRKEKPEYFIIHLITSIPLSLILFFNYDTRFILRVSGNPKLNFFRKMLWKLSAKNIHKIFCPTELTKQFLIKNNIFSKNKIYVVEDPIIDVNKIFSKNKDAQIKSNFDLFDKKYLISIGRLTKQKNFKFLISNFKKILEKYNFLELVILGDGEEKNSLSKLVEKLKISDSVHFLGSKKNIYPYLKNSLFFVLTSDWEDPGFVIIEAMYSKKIVFSSNCDNGPKEIISDQVNGFLYENKNSQNFLKKFDMVMDTLENTKIKKKILLSALKKTKKYSLFSHFKNISKHLL